MATSFIGSADDRVDSSDIAAGPHNAGSDGPTLSITWPSSTVGDIVFWVLAYNVELGRIDVARTSTDGADWDTVLIDSILWRSGTARGYYLLPNATSGERAQYLFGGVFYIQDADDLDVFTNFHIGWDLDSETDGRTYAFSGAFSVAVYRPDPTELVDFTWEVFTEDGSGNQVPAVYGLTQGDLVARAIAYLSVGDDDASPPSGPWERGEIGVDALDPPGTWTVREHNFGNQGGAPSGVLGTTTHYALIAGCDIDDKATVSDIGEPWNGNSGVILQLVFNDSANPDPAPTPLAGGAGAFRVPYPKWAYEGGVDGGPDGTRAVLWQLNQNYAAVERLCRAGAASKCQLILTRNPTATWQEYNWFRIERWANDYVQTLGCMCEGAEIVPTAETCLLYVPYKRWSTTSRDPRHEMENWQAVENWAGRLRTADCECIEEPQEG